MIEDLSRRHELVGDLFSLPETCSQWDQYRLSEEQLQFYQQNGYVAGVRILSDEQVDALRRELAELTDPQHAGHELWYEYHSNESSVPGQVFTTCCGIRLLLCPPVSCSTGRFGSGMTSCFASRRGTGVSWPGIKTTRTGRAPNRWRI